MRVLKWCLIALGSVIVIATVGIFVATTLATPFSSEFKTTGSTPSSPAVTISFE